MSEMKIWKETGFVTDDPWQVAGEDQSADANAKLLLPLAQYLELDDTDRRPESTGVILEPADEVSQLEPFLDRLALIAVTFPVFNDGRAYSQGSLLRERLGFDGELRAMGDVLIDQVPLMLRCGIDSFAVTNGTAIKRLSEGHLPGIDSYYQPAAVPSRSTGSYAWRSIGA
ncbi:DUF934 domain-containing protein [Hoeflea prorocentri]|uniref:DUF934 domain-containing protein n=1 Tax=Hoeflea prorocentri TaxID=1922333 RepID=A0A9X3UET7_9HYPH|nr:DUF934 domain-containing protein [Hoeflea prorocentri]MCY6379219.1 DUF934 domain-containing protein [Hoeflea prorocentri]MDA5397020.1 DUF934 domain-containing protein [Hoeflea prorocentri]